MTDAASTTTSSTTTTARLRALAERWAAAKSAERANAQSYLIELTEALGVERPRPAGSGYEFEYPVRVVNRDGTETTNFVDLVKRDHFLLEAKDDAGGAGGKSPEVLLRKAFGQARSYAANLPGAQRDIVARHLETLAIMGEIREMIGGRYAALAVTA